MKIKWSLPRKKKTVMKKLTHQQAALLIGFYTSLQTPAPNTFENHIDNRNLKPKLEIHMQNIL